MQETCTPLDQDNWQFMGKLNDGDEGVIDDLHSIVYDYLPGRVIRYQYIKGDGRDAVSGFGS